MRALFSLALAAALGLPTALSAQTHYDNQRQYREYKNLSEATQRAYSVPDRPAPRPSSSSSSSGNSSSYSPRSSSSYSSGSNSSPNEAAQQLVDQWRRNDESYRAAKRARDSAYYQRMVDRARRAAAPPPGPVYSTPSTEGFNRYLATPAGGASLAATSDSFDRALADFAARSRAAEEAARRAREQPAEPRPVLQGLQLSEAPAKSGQILRSLELAPQKPAVKSDSILRSLQLETK